MSTPRRQSEETVKAQGHAEDLSDLIREIARESCHTMSGPGLQGDYDAFLTLHAFLNSYVILRECPWNIGRDMTVNTFGEIVGRQAAQP